MIWFLFWIIGAALVSLLGGNSTLGKAGIFMISLVFSPLIGLVVCLVTEKSKQQIAEELAAIKENTAPEKRYTSMEEKIELLDKAKKLLDEGVITDEQFTEMKLEIMRRKENSTFEERCPNSVEDEEPEVAAVPLVPAKPDNIFLRVVLGFVVLAVTVVLIMAIGLRSA